MLYGAFDCSSNKKSCFLPCVLDLAMLVCSWGETCAQSLCPDSGLGRQGAPRSLWRAGQTCPWICSQIVSTVWNDFYITLFSAQELCNVQDFTVCPFTEKHLPLLKLTVIPDLRRCPLVMMVCGRIEPQIVSSLIQTIIFHWQDYILCLHRYKVNSTINYCWSQHIYEQQQFILYFPIEWYGAV